MQNNMYEKNICGDETLWSYIEEYTGFHELGIWNENSIWNRHHFCDQILCNEDILGLVSLF